MARFGRRNKQAEVKVEQPATLQEENKNEEITNPEENVNTQNEVDNEVKVETKCKPQTLNDFLF